MKKTSLILCTILLVAAAFVSCKNGAKDMTDVTVEEYFFDGYVVTGTIKETVVETEASGNPLTTEVTTTVSTYEIKAPDGNTDKTINNGLTYRVEDKSVNGNINAKLSMYGGACPTVSLYAYNLYIAGKMTEQVTTNGTAAPATTVDEFSSTSFGSMGYSYKTIGSLSIEASGFNLWDVSDNKLARIENYCGIDLYEIDGDYYFLTGSGFVKVDVDEDALEDGETFTISYTEKIVADQGQETGSSNVDKTETTVEVNLTFTAQ